MKKQLLSFFLLLFISVTALLAQAPQQLNYQAVVRDVSGQPLGAGSNVTVRFKIHDGSPQGAIVFTEITSAITNQFGLIIHRIGSVSPLSTVNWGSGPKYLQVEIDITEPMRC